METDVAIANGHTTSAEQPHLFPTLLYRTLPPQSGAQEPCQCLSRENRKRDKED